MISVVCCFLEIHKGINKNFFMFYIMFEKQFIDNMF
jgi:hypothetical protein